MGTGLFVTGPFGRGQVGNEQVRTVQVNLGQVNLSHDWSCLVKKVQVYLEQLKSGQGRSSQGGKGEVKKFCRPNNFLEHNFFDPKSF